MNNSLKVAILISTMNRPDFLIRTLHYYAKLESPHPVYIADSSNPENAEIIKSSLKKLGNRLEIHYNWYPPGLETHGRTLSLVKEKYAVSNGDDDYQIPSTLTKGAEFLERNPDYIAAGGHGVNFRLTTSGPYGEIKRLTDYPNHSLEAQTASERIVEFLKKCYVITFSVTRVDTLKTIFAIDMPILTTWSELYQNCFCAVSGKVKLMDRLGVVRQMHDRQYHASSMVDWLTEKGFNDYYHTFDDILSKKIIEIDQVSEEEARGSVKKAFWEYLKVYMANETKALRADRDSAVAAISLKSLRARTGTFFPVLKTMFRKHLRPFISDKKQMHYEVTNPRSPYYNDFQAVQDSFSGKDKENN